MVRLLLQTHLWGCELRPPGIVFLSIFPLIEGLTGELAGEDYEIIVVDDNSPDGTSRVVKEAMKRFGNLRLLTRTSERGLVSSIRDGIGLSKGNICIWMDGR